MALSSDTPIAETENLDKYPAAPEGFHDPATPGKNRQVP